TRKHVWFQLDLPDRPVGIRSAGPVLPTSLLPVTDQRVRVAVAQIDSTGAISAWNDDAAYIFGHTAEQVIGKQFTDFVAWPHTPGT
ncbi:PAS domain S-box protein, partial [Streptomyces sp. SID7499]|nr:PAS domain S-box protein [Streptomyces sp. SID7499]